MKWAKEGEIWKITSMKYVLDGSGHLGLPPAHAAHDAFVTGMASYTGGTVHGRRAQEAMWGGAPASASVVQMPRRLQSSPQYGNLDPSASRLPTGLDSSNSVQMLWDRFAIQERISMYSWLADELRVNDPKGYVWGDMFADDASFCIYASGALVSPKFSEIVDGATVLGRPVVGGPGSPECSAALGVTCTSCTGFMGTYAQGSMAFMTRAQFGFNSAATSHHQQTRHTLTNWIFLEQTATTAITQMYNTLERFVPARGARTPDRGSRRRQAPPARLTFRATPCVHTDRRHRVRRLVLRVPASLDQGGRRLEVGEDHGDERG